LPGHFGVMAVDDKWMDRFNRSLRHHRVDHFKKCNRFTFAIGEEGFMM
jgi:hypothetical protein